MLKAYRVLVKKPFGRPVNTDSVAEECVIKVYKVFYANDKPHLLRILNSVNVSYEKKSIEEIE